MTTSFDAWRIGAVVIGASAGGVEALNRLLPVLPKTFASPVLVVVHVRQGQPSLLPALFATRCMLAIEEPFDKDEIAPGTVYFAPPGLSHMIVEAEGGAAPAIALSVDPPVRFSRPSVNVLFESAAHAYRERLLGIVLSGANDDGARGARAILEAGDACWAQNPEMAVAPAMPLAAIAEDAVNEVKSRAMHRRQANAAMKRQGKEFPDDATYPRADRRRHSQQHHRARSVARATGSVGAESGIGTGRPRSELLLKHEVALAILDVNMPGMDGFELAELMRGSPRTAHVPIIFLTATAQDAGRTFRGYEAGAVDFLYKPFDSRILNSKVDVFIQMERQKQQLSPPCSNCSTRTRC
ncbi:MAG: Two-component system sensor histidine kinase/response regulator hybrid [uncultured Caballeronia sp.]|nr:MAG: Two-component system sensor histidine kinase/response regulator hybrid [uncultured Caballeronia sp.]